MILHETPNRVLTVDEVAAIDAQCMTARYSDDRTNPQHAKEFTPVLDRGPINPPRYGD